MKNLKEVDSWLVAFVKPLYPEFIFASPSLASWTLAISAGFYVTVKLNKRGRIYISGVRNGWFIKEEFYLTWKEGELKEMTKLAKTKINKILEVLNTPG